MSVLYGFIETFVDYTPELQVTQLHFVIVCDSAILLTVFVDNVCDERDIASHLNSFTIHLLQLCNTR